MLCVVSEVWPGLVYAPPVSGFELVAALVGSLAWPVVVVVVVVVLRKQLRDLVAKLIARLVDLTEVSGWGLSMKFKEKLDELEREVEEMSAKASTGTKPEESKPESAGAPGKPQESAQAEASTTESSEKAVPEEDPLVILLRAYRVVERATTQAALRNGIDPKRATHPMMALKLLSAKVSIDAGLRNVVADLAQLRNQAVHEDLQVSREDAERFAWIADDIAEYLNRL